MKINKQLLLEDYLKWVDEITENVDWKAHFSPKEIIDQVAQMVDTNRYYNSTIKNLIKVEKETEFKHLVKNAWSGKLLGAFVLSLNGEWFFIAATGTEYWNFYTLHAIGYHLEELNRDLNQQLQNHSE